MLSASDLAKLVLSFGSVSHKKLQKLCYYVYSWYLTIYKEKICDVCFEAWVHGPVSPQIYYEYKNYGWISIPKYDEYLSVSKKVYDLAEKVFNEYSAYSADELERKTHGELPWINARKGYKKYEPSNEIIKDDDIVNFYKNIDLYRKFIET